MTNNIQELIVDLLVNQLILMVIAYFFFIFFLLGLGLVMCKFKKYVVLVWSGAVFFFTVSIYLFIIGLKLFDGSFDSTMNIAEELSNNFFIQLLISAFILFSLYSVIFALASLLGHCLIYIFQRVMKITEKIPIKASALLMSFPLFLVLSLFLIVSRIVSWFGGY